MLIEVKSKVTRIVDNKHRRTATTFVLDCDLFSTAENKIIQLMENEMHHGTVTDYEIQALKLSTIKEICKEFKGQYPFIATLKDTFINDEGEEKPLKYNVLLWADNSVEALGNTIILASEGYDMEVIGIKQVDYEYLEV